MPHHEKTIEYVIPTDEEGKPTYNKNDDELEEGKRYPQIQIRQATGMTYVLILKSGDKRRCAGTSKERYRVGPGVIVEENNLSGTRQREHYIDDPKAWRYVDTLCNIGASACRNEGIDVMEREKETKEREEYINRNL